MDKKARKMRKHQGDQKQQLPALVERMSVMVLKLCNNGLCAFLVRTT